MAEKLNLEEITARKTALLHEARRARMRWVLQARDTTNPLQEDSNTYDSSSSDTANATSSNTSSEVKASTLRKIPAAGCVQEVLDFLHSLLPAEEEAIDVNSLLLSLQDETTDEDIDRFMREGLTDQFSYDFFLRSLLQPAAASLVKLMQQFTHKANARGRNVSQLRSISVAPQAAEQGPLEPGELFVFLDHCGEALADLSPYRDLPPADSTTNASTSSSSSSNSGLLAAGLAHLERFLFRQLHSLLFTNAATHEEIGNNHRTAERIAALAFITPEHLDLKAITQIADPTRRQLAIDTLLARPIAALKAMTVEIAPADKLSSLRRCCQCIASALKDLQADGHALPGADELLPVLILAVKAANPTAIHSQLRYLQKFLRPSALLSEAGYLLTNLVSAVYFLDHVDARALTIEPEAFEAALKSARSSGKQQSQLAVALAQQQAGSSSSSHGNDNKEGGDQELSTLLAKHKQRLKAVERAEFVSIQELSQQQMQQQGRRR